MWWEIMEAQSVLHLYSIEPTHTEIWVLLEDQMHHQKSRNRKVTCWDEDCCWLISSTKHTSARLTRWLSLVRQFSLFNFRAYNARSRLSLPFTLNYDSLYHPWHTDLSMKTLWDLNDHRTPPNLLHPFMPFNPKLHAPPRGPCANNRVCFQHWLSESRAS